MPTGRNRASHVVVNLARLWYLMYTCTYSRGSRGGKGAGKTPMLEHAGQFTVVEHWTDSETCLALVGPPPALQAIARDLAVPDDAVVTLQPNRSVLGLWGDSLTAYRQWRRSGATPMATQLVVWAA
jgi:hypothetical protein